MARPSSSSLLSPIKHRALWSVVLIVQVSLIVNYASQMAHSNPAQVTAKSVVSSSDVQDHHQAGSDYYVTVDRGARIPPSSIMDSGMIERLLASLPGKNLGKYEDDFIKKIDRNRNNDKQQHQEQQENDSSRNEQPGLTNSAISPDDRKCYIEVQTVERKQGKCAKLGANGMPFCLTQDFIAIDTESCS